MPDNPKVSVLMPAYNTEKYITEAIESILNQTFKEFELIIIDDCSTDRTWEIIQDYTKKDNRIIALRNEKNLGIPENRNKLISLSKGKYVVWQDSDDISMPYRIEKQYNFMENHPDVGICGGWLLFFNNNNNKIYTQKYNIKDTFLRKNIFKFSPVSQGVSIVRKKIYNKVGNYNILFKQAEDLDMSFRIGMHSKYSNIPEVLLKYRFDYNSISKSKVKENIKYTLKVRKLAINKYNYKISYFDYLVYYITYFVKFLPRNFIFFIFRKFRKI